MLLFSIFAKIRKRFGFHACCTPPQNHMPKESLSTNLEMTQETENKLFRGRVFGGDAALWVIIVALAVISLLVIYSSTAPMAYSKAHGNTSFYVLNQLRFLLFGFMAIFIIHRFNYQTYLKYTRLLFAFAIGLMMLTFFIGVSANDATRSLRLGGFTFQPADFVKVTLIMTLAKSLGKRQKVIKTQDIMPRLRFGLTEKQREHNRWVIRNNTFPLVVPVALSCGLIFFSNFSTAALLFLACLVMMYVCRVRGRELWRLVRTVVLTVALAIAIMYPLDVGRSRTWVGRMASFAGVENLEATNAVDERSEDQVLNAKMAIASGGLLGRGPGQSVQRTNLALPFSDYAYAFIAEEYGLVGCIVVLALYLWLFFRTTVIFKACHRTFPGILVLGLGILIVVQALVSMMVAVDLFPVTGLPLPLVSLGGSSILFTSIALGMILGISRQMQEKTLDEKNI